MIPAAPFLSNRFSRRVPGAGALRLAVRAGREARARAALAPRRRGRGPMAVFLPAGPPQGAALLRIYNVAEALRPLGWRTAVLPSKLTLAGRRRYLAAARPDIVVMQGVRHALNRPALYPGVPIVFDIDDADFHLDRFAGPMREAMGGVTSVVAGSRYIAEWCRENGAPEARVIWTGTPVSPAGGPAHAARPPVVAWAQTRPGAYHREAALVARVMAGVAARRPGVTLRLYDRRAGDDPAFVDRFRAPGLAVEWWKACPYRDYLDSFGDVAVGLAPLCPETPFSRGKSFGKVLAYLDRGVVVVGSDAGEHGAFFTGETGVITDDEAAWVDGIVRLLDAAAIRQEIAGAARECFAARLSVAAAAAGMADVLASRAGGLRGPWSPGCLPRSVRAGWF